MKEIGCVWSYDSNKLQTEAAVRLDLKDNGVQRFRPVRDAHFAPRVSNSKYYCRFRSCHTRKVVRVSNRQERVGISSATKRRELRAVSIRFLVGFQNQVCPILKAAYIYIKQQPAAILRAQQVTQKLGFHLSTYSRTHDFQYVILCVRFRETCEAFALSIFSSPGVLVFIYCDKHLHLSYLGDTLGFHVGRRLTYAATA